MVKGSYAKYQGAVATMQMLEPKQEQNPGNRAGRPHRSVERLVVTGIVVLIAAAHDPQRGG